jgi:hypothetical protein
MHFICFISSCERPFYLNNRICSKTIYCVNSLCYYLFLDLFWNIYNFWFKKRKEFPKNGNARSASRTFGPFPISFSSLFFLSLSYDKRPHVSFSLSHFSSFSYSSPVRACSSRLCAASPPLLITSAPIPRVSWSTTPPHPLPFH